MRGINANARAFQEKNTTIAQEKKTKAAKKKNKPVVEKETKAVKKKNKTVVEKESKVVKKKTKTVTKGAAGKNNDKKKTKTATEVIFVLFVFTGVLQHPLLAISFFVSNCCVVGTKTKRRCWDEQKQVRVQIPTARPCHEWLPGLQREVSSPDLWTIEREVQSVLPRRSVSSPQRPRIGNHGAKDTFAKLGKGFSQTICGSADGDNA